MRKDGILKNLFKNKDYILYYAKILLKTRVSGNYLGALWLYIDPLMFMLIYSFIVKVVFKSRIENFNVYVLIGLTVWNLFSRSVMMGATAIVRNKAIFEQVYFHKFVYPSLYLLSYIYEFLIAMSLVFIMIIVSGIPITWHLVEIIPVFLVCVFFTYGCTLIVSHIGVYLFDLRNILDFSLRFVFYLTPIMWKSDTLDFALAHLLKKNPMAIILDSMRACIMYGESPEYKSLLIIAVVSFILVKIGYGLISKYEDEYARMI